MCSYRVSSPKEIFERILPHFDNYPLITKKCADYLLFREIVMKVLRGEHRELAGLQSIVNIRATLNLGLSKKFKEAFPSTAPVVRPSVGKPNIPAPEWLAGFSTGEGCFYIQIKRGRNKVGVGFLLVFQLTQHIRDIELLGCVASYLGSGHVVVPKNKD